MATSVEHISPAKVKHGLRKVRLSQAEGARRIGKSEAMVSMVLNKKAKSQPILDALGKLIRDRLAGNGQQAA